jgi:phosphohistidine swiveling domain-containing protein
MHGYILGLDSKLALQETQAGGKGASLAWLHRNGFHVPPGFVITSTAFRHFMANLGSETLAHRREWTQDDLEQIRGLLVAGYIPLRLVRSIGRAYRKLGGRVAVRSSMVGEDTHVASFAGQLDTFLDVEGESELAEAVKRCWASMFNWRLFSYLAEREMTSAGPILQSLSMAVVVQRMVDARAAGAAFSADPVTGQPCVVIEATRGLGDALVRGLVEPDRYVVGARGVIAQASPASAGAPALTDEQVLRLAEAVRNVAGMMKNPQDVEWALDGTGFHLLQSRPITSLIERRVYSTTMVSDMLPGLVKPLVWSVSTTSILKNVFGRVFTELIGPNEIDFTLLCKRIHSRMYADNTMLGELLGRMGLPANFFEVMSRDERAARRQRMPLTRTSLPTMVRLLRFAWRYSRPAGEISAFVERHARELEPYRQADPSAEHPQVLLARAEQLMDIYSRTMWANFIGPINMMGRNRMLSQLVQRWAPDIVPSDLLRGLMGLKSLETNRALWHLAVQARGLGDTVQRLLTEENDQTIRATLSASEEGRTLVDKIDTFLDRYGFLSASGTDPSQTPWVENPTLIWHAIGRLALDAREPVKEDVEAIREEAQNRVRANLNWMHRILFDRLLASTIAYMRLREETSVLISEDSFEMRRTFLALADRLIQRGTLDERDDIFYLAYDQVRALVEGQLGADVARELVATRRAAMEADALIVPPDTICGEYVPTPLKPLAAGQEYLVGISGSSGLARGHARIVLDPLEAPVTLGREDILVVPFTDVSWTPLFSGVGGIIAETGGQLSHSAIVAREYGLPAVVSVKHATRLIQDGQPVTVDGSNGRVYLN